MRRIDGSGLAYRKAWRQAWLSCLLLLSCGPNPDTLALLSNDCILYCALASLACRQSNLLYSSTAACRSACAQFPVVADSQATTGNSLQCRLNYLRLANTNAFTFCLNASVSGGVTCH